LLQLQNLTGAIAERHSLSTTFRVFGPVAMAASVGYFVLAVRVHTSKKAPVVQVEHEAMIKDT